MLWSPQRFRALCVAQLVAIVLVQIAAYQIRNSGDFSEQSDWTTLAVLGLLAGVLASAAWLLTGRRSVGRRRACVSRSAAAVFDTPTMQSAEDPRRVASAAMTHYHRPACPLARGKDTFVAPVVEHQRSRRTPCAVCGA